MTQSNNPWVDLNLAQLQVITHATKQIHKTAVHLADLSKDVSQLRKAWAQRYDFPECLSVAAMRVLNRTGQLSTVLRDQHGGSVGVKKDPQIRLVERMRIEHDTLATRAADIASNLDRLAGQTQAQAHCREILAESPDLQCRFDPLFTSLPFATLARQGAEIEGAADEAKLAAFAREFSRALGERIKAVADFEADVARQITGVVPVVEVVEIEEQINIVEPVVVVQTTATATEPEVVATPPRTKISKTGSARGGKR